MTKGTSPARRRAPARDRRRKFALWTAVAAAVLAAGIPALSATPLSSAWPAGGLIQNPRLVRLPSSTPGPLPPALLAKTKTAAGRIWYPPSARSSTHGQAALPFNALSASRINTASHTF